MTGTEAQAANVAYALNSLMADAERAARLEQQRQDDARMLSRGAADLAAGYAQRRTQ